MFIEEYDMKKEKLKVFANRVGGHNIHTPFSLVETIISKTAFDVDSTSKIAVLYNIEFVLSLIAIKGVDPKNITFFGDCSKKKQLVESWKCKYVKISKPSDLEKNMKFDVIVGNPPYSDENNRKGKNKLWIDFINKSFSLLKDNGKLTLVTPNGWISSTNNSYEFLKNRLLYADISKSVSEMFGNTGGTQRFGWWTIEKSDNPKDMPTIKFDEGEYDIDILANPHGLPKSSSVYSFSIVKKLHEKLDFVPDWKRINTSDPQRNCVSVPLAKSATWNVKWFGAEKEDYVSGNLDRYTVFCDSAVGNMIAENLNRKVYQLLRWELRSGPSLAGNFKTLPLPSIVFDNDHALYEYLDLKREEIDYIEANVK